MRFAGAVLVHMNPMVHLWTPDCANYGHHQLYHAMPCKEENAVNKVTMMSMAPGGS